MTLLKSLSLDELFFLINCKNITAFNNKFGEARAKQLLNEINLLDNVEDQNHKIIKSLYLAITDLPKYPLLICWTILNLVSFGIISLTLVTIMLSLFILLTGGIYFYSNYLKLNDEAEANKQLSQLTDLKLQCADLLIDYQTNEINKLKINHGSKFAWRPKIQELQVNFNDAPQYIIHKVKQSVESGIIVTTSLFQSYYLGLQTLISTSLLPIAALAGPIGIGAVLSVCLAIGIYCGYKSYQTYQKEELLKNHQNEINNMVESKCSKCNELKEKLFQLKCMLTKKQTGVTKAMHTRYPFASNPMILANNQRKKQVPALQQTRYEYRPRA